MFFKKTGMQTTPCPTRKGRELFAEIIAFGKQDTKASTKNLRPEPAENPEVKPSIAETKQSSSKAFIPLQGGATIYYSRNGEEAEAYYPSPTLTVAKARILLKSGHAVYVVDSKGNRFLPEDFDRLLAFDGPRVALGAAVALAETKIDAVLDVLNDILTDTSAGSVPSQSLKYSQPVKVHRLDF